jgi:acylphosphatase
MTALRFLVTGRVQGVGFRWSAVQEAERIGVAGWVRNLPSGEVEAIVAGSDEAVERMADWLRQGPRGARVDRLASAPADESDAPSPFELRR